MEAQWILTGDQNCKILSSESWTKHCFENYFDWGHKNELISTLVVWNSLWYETLQKQKNIPNFKSITHKNNSQSNKVVVNMNKKKIKTKFYNQI